MTRIVAGTVGGRSLQVPPKGTRPTSDRVREAIFSRLEHYGVLDGAYVLDLYAGSGALGLEAASRGAQRVVLVDAARVAAEVCRANVRTLGLTNVQVVQDKAEKFVQSAPATTWDVVFIDPPYDVSEAVVAELLRQLAQTSALVEDAVVVVERSTRSPEPTWPTAWELLARKDYGETAVFYAGPVAAEEPQADAS
ncbi:16S rRNA (guanine(966)-N(2))-methyltransferase RsmD [Oerskovia turbata]|uniref:16S rRNA (Guanine(966)-N(2))-methyltransferase RsmD n=1 Tax=Oerskovia turbata TaxID=1713 RepID=A0A4Q1L056_9CELL|nr:16S rRNA (guanine(966)-N(2))-methyltransferase RsmD [Oerskovia turbata]RXR28044.1 16S rRNA (guanine(966)-N(2))-methyltransferase RsmD [Oerskovia turbata]RXR35947.1 16S rRNA (guanine(966)-N(2))-methyltransferase RsmD [Oerskovia turbata]TGJ94860.1 16S rRNA (guanine(966)-N(2))-methyltransferase RsmD [Actinotalea fermentans ATCC 43279 = JCM 9966 = DSM 3133]